MATTTVTTGYLQRLIGAAALDVGTYEEIEADEGATTQAFATVLLSSLAAGIGASGFGGNTISNIAFVGTVSLLSWMAWALVTFEIGVRLMPQPATRSSPGELMRTIGFASTPGFLRIMGVLPGGTTMAFVVSSVWMLAAMVIAVRQSLDYDNTARAVLVCIVGWTLALAMAIGLGLLFGPTLH